jgi:hypothetical protein
MFTGVDCERRRTKTLAVDGREPGRGYAARRLIARDGAIATPSASAGRPFRRRLLCLI